MSITKNVPLNWYSSMKKKIEKDSDNFWHSNLTLKVRNWQFSITWFRVGVDLPDFFFYGKRKSAIFHSIKLPFDVQAAEKNLTCYLIYRFNIEFFEGFFFCI